MPIGKIGQRHQAVIPKEISDALGLHTGGFSVASREHEEYLAHHIHPLTQ